MYNEPTQATYHAEQHRPEDTCFGIQKIIFGRMNGSGRQVHAYCNLSSAINAVSVANTINLGES